MLFLLILSLIGPTGVLLLWLVGGLAVTAALLWLPKLFNRNDRDL